MSQTITYSTTGTHCHACEILIEKEIRSIPGVQSVVASVKSQSVKIVAKNPPTIKQLNKIFQESGYVFSSFPFSRGDALRAEGLSPDIFISLLIVSALLGLYFLLNYFGVFALVNVSPSSFLPSLS